MATPSMHLKKKAVIPDEAYGFFSWLILTAGALLFTVFGSIVWDTPGEVAACVILWLAIYMFIGLRIVQNMDYLVIERFGEFNRIVHSGPRILCFPGLIDKVVAQDTLRWRELPLFADEAAGYRVDFKDGSTPVSMKASYRVGPQGGTPDELDEAIYRFTYSMKTIKEREERIEEILESAAVPRLQALEIGDALLQKDSVAEQVTADSGVRDAIEAIGIELNPQKGLIIPDIDLTPEIIEQRQKKLQGASEASKQSAQGAGYALAIKAIMENLEVDFKTARGIYETQRGLEVLGTVNANVSFVAPGMEGIQKTMGVGDVNPRRNQERRQK